MSSELKPCPFCGGVGKVMQHKGHGWKAYCDNPFCAWLGVRPTKQEAIAAWNQRAERTCDGCVYDLPNGMSADLCLICVRNAPDMYKKVVE